MEEEGLTFTCWEVPAQTGIQRMKQRLMECGDWSGTLDLITTHGYQDIAPTWVGIPGFMQMYHSFTGKLFSGNSVAAGIPENFYRSFVHNN